MRLARDMENIHDISSVSRSYKSVPKKGLSMCELHLNLPKALLMLFVEFLP